MKVKTKFILMASLSSLLLLTTACSWDQSKQIHSSKGSAESNEASDSKEGIEDRQIIDVIMTIDKNEIALAKEVSKKGGNKKVELFAKYLIRQHERNLDHLIKLAKEVGLEPLSSPLSTTLAADGQEGLKKLSALNGKEFDKAFIDAMVKGHEAGLALIDSNLSKNATNPHLKTFIGHTRAMVDDHFHKALRLQKTVE